MIGELYWLYSRKSTEKNKIFKYASIVSAMLSVSIIFFMYLLLHTYQLKIADHTKAMNGANVKILDKDYLVHLFSQEQVDSVQETFSKENAAYTLGYCDITNVIFGKEDDKKDGMLSLTVLNNNDMALNMGFAPLKSKEMVISEDAAKRLGVRAGDFLYVKLHSDTYADTTFKIAKIIGSDMIFSAAGSEYEVAQEALGNAYVVLPEFDRYNAAFSDCDNSVAIEGLKNKLAPEFHVRTLKELESIVNQRTEFQMQILELISSIALVLSGICLVWSFIIFIIDRKKDFLIFTNIGMHKKDLGRFILLEMYSLIIKGLSIGIPLGGVAAALYLQMKGLLVSVSLPIVMKGIVLTVFFVLVETSVFSLLPISYIKAMVHNNSENKIPVKSIFAVVCMFPVIAGIYVRSSVGVYFFIVVGIVFLLFYAVLNGITKLILWIMGLNKRADFLRLSNLKEELKTSVVSLSIINITLVLLFLLIQIIPMLMTDANDGSGFEAAGVTYRSTRQTIAETLLAGHQIKYSKYYTEHVKVLKVNGKDIEACMEPGLSEDYRAASVEVMREEAIMLFPNDNMPEMIKQQKGFCVNNRYQNIINYKKGDILTVLINGTIVTFPIAELYVDTNSSNMLGMASETYMEQQGYLPNPDDDVTCVLNDRADREVLLQLLAKDSKAYIDKNQQLSEYLKKYVDNQKGILVNNIIAVGFSSVLLVLLAQIMQFVRKKEYYLSLWKIGMSKKYFIKSILLDKILLSAAQVLVISIFIEPVRLLIAVEDTARHYEVSVPLIIAELVLVLSINVFSVLLPACYVGAGGRK